MVERSETRCLFRLLNFCINNEPNVKLMTSYYKTLSGCAQYKLQLHTMTGRWNIRRNLKFWKLQNWNSGKKQKQKLCLNYTSFQIFNWLNKIQPIKRNHHRGTFKEMTFAEQNPSEIGSYHKNINNILQLWRETIFTVLQNLRTIFFSFFALITRTSGF